MKRSSISSRLLGIMFALCVTLGLAAPALAQGEGGRVLFGENFTLHSGETLYGDLAIFGGSATIEAGSRVNGDIFVSGGNVSVAGTVDGSIVVLGGDLQLAATAVVMGDVSTLGGNLLRADGSRVMGRSTSGRVALPPIVVLPAPTQIPLWDWAGFATIWGLARTLISVFLSAVIIAIVALLIALVAEKPARQIGVTALGAPWISLALGFLTVAAAVTAALLFIITLCLSPFGLLLLLALVLATVYGWAALSLLIGERILIALDARNVSPLWAALLGAFLLTLVARVPCIGWLLALIVGMAGLGAIVLTRGGAIPYPRPPLIQPVAPPEPAAPRQEACPNLEPPSPPAPPTPSEPAG